jgi:hypothetical protein
MPQKNTKIEPSPESYDDTFDIDTMWDIQDTEPKDNPVSRDADPKDNPVLPDTDPKDNPVLPENTPKIPNTTASRIDAKARTPNDIPSESSQVGLSVC